MATPVLHRRRLAQTHLRAAEVQAVGETYTCFETEQWYGTTPAPARLADSATAGGGSPEECGAFVATEQARLVGCGG